MQYSFLLIGTLLMHRFQMLFLSRYDLAVHLPIDLKGNMLDGQRKCFEVQQLVSGYELLNKTGILCYCKVQKVN